jgi:hypothetical protein
MNKPKCNESYLLSACGSMLYGVDIDLLTLCFPLDNGVYKFNGCGTFNYFQYNEKSRVKEYNIDKKNPFFNKMSIFKDEKKSIKLFNNGNFHITGFNYEEALDFIEYILNNIINKDYYLLTFNNDINKYELKLVSKNMNNKLINIKKHLFNKTYRLPPNIIFSHLKKQNIRFDPLSNLEVYYIREQFKSTSISLDLRTIDLKEKIGYLTLFEKTFVISCVDDSFRTYLENLFSNNEFIKDITIEKKDIHTRIDDLLKII